MKEQVKISPKYTSFLQAIVFIIIFTAGVKGRRSRVSSPLFSSHICIGHFVDIFVGTNRISLGFNYLVLLAITLKLEM